MRNFRLWQKQRAGVWTAVFLLCSLPGTAYAVGPGELQNQQTHDQGPSGPGQIGPGVYVDMEGNVVSGVKEKGITVTKYQNRASEGQGGIDWQQVKDSGVGFAMVRIGYHNDLDPYYHENMTNAAQAGLKTGVFFYTQALDTDTSRAEAEFVLSQIRDYPISYPVAYDLESGVILEAGLTKQQITDQANAFCRVIARAGYRPVIYANQEWLANHLDAAQLLDDEGRPFDIWYARYGTIHEYPNRTIWQCTDSGQVKGIQGNVTIEYCFADYGSLIPAEVSCWTARLLRAMRLVSTAAAMRARRAPQPASLRSSPRAIPSFRAGSPASLTAGSPSSICPRTPATPWCRYNFCPAVTAFSSVSPAKSAATRPLVMAAQASRTVSVCFHCSLGRRPSAPQRIPMEKTAPLWVLTPPVAENIAASALLPANRIRSKV